LTCQWAGLTLATSIMTTSSLKIFLSFLRLGSTTFGGPAGAIAAMERANVEQKWMNHHDFAIAVTATKLLPGPVATQLAIWIGRSLGGAKGGVAAGCGFVLPAFSMVMALWFSRDLWIDSSLTPAFLAAIQGAAVSVIAVTSWNLFRPYAKQPFSWLVAALAGAVTFFWARYEPLAIVLAGLAAVALHKPVPLVNAPLTAAKNETPNGRTSRFRKGLVMAALLVGILIVVQIFTHNFNFGRGLQLFWVPFKAAAITFGTGFAVLPVLEAEFVTVHQYLTSAQFLEAVAVGQMTPGPIIISASYLGFLAGGFGGGILSTAGAFLPSFINVLILVPRWAGALLSHPKGLIFVRGAVPAVVGGLILSAGRLSLPHVSNRAFLTGLVLSTLLGSWKKIPTWAVLLLSATGGLAQVWF
jgi:chromate transporter